MKNRLQKRILFVFLANFFLALGVALMKLSDFGTDPFASMNIGVSNHLPISYGTMAVVSNLVLCIPVLMYKRSAIGIGAIINMFLLAYIVEFHLYWLSLINITVQTISVSVLLRAVFLVAGIILLCLDVAIYMRCDLGQGAYDVLSDIIEERTKGKIPFRWARIIADIFCMSVGFITGATVSIGTLFTAFCTGPLVSFFRENVANKIL